MDSIVRLLSSVETKFSKVSFFIKGTSPYRTSTLSASSTSFIPHLTASPVPIGEACSHVEISKSKLLDSLIIEFLSNPTIRVIFALMLSAVLQIISSMVFPPTLCKDFALLDFILDPSPAARIIVCMFTI